MNDRYLIASYFVMALLAVCIGGVVYLFLRGPFQGITAAGAHKKLRPLLNTLFPVGIVLPALLGFLSVSYFGCGHQEYAKIVQDRAYLIHKTQEQVSSILLSVALAILAWDLVIALAIKLCSAAQTRQS